MRLEEHPTVKQYRGRSSQEIAAHTSKKLEAEWLRRLALESGADDVGFIDVGRSTLSDYRQDLLRVMPDIKSIMCMVFRLNKEPLRSLAHSIANIEFRHMWSHANATARKTVRRLQDQGIRALNTPAGFPFEADRWPGKIWLTCAKVIAAEAGLGHMGWNRLVIHPRFGDFIIIGNVLLASEVDHYDKPLEFNPCLECKLCVAVCPVGAIHSDGTFDFVSCYSHNYRERLGGFQDWVENIAESKNRADYRKRINDSETISMWQNLSIGAQTRCDRCMAVCPAGEEVIGEFLENRKEYSGRYMKPFREKKETIYVVAGSDAEAHVTSKFPSKKVRRISNGMRAGSTRAFL
jgi:epoxyqueuosine reductase QueG